VFEFGPSGYASFEDPSLLRDALGCWPEMRADWSDEEQELHDTHLRAAQGLSASIAGFHGQTLAHAPHEQRSFQLGDGAALAQALGMPVVWDFRTADLKSGGQGAPLAPIYHHALARLGGLAEPVVFLNIGGVANVTWLDPQQGPETIRAFDTGPGNALIDDFVKARTGAERDEAGALAARGQVDQALLAAWLEDPYFERMSGSLDRNAFEKVLLDLAGHSVEDGCASLSAFTVATIARARFEHTPQRWLVAGGGRHNRTLMAGLQQALNQPVDPVERFGWDGDMLEAQAFAYLAVRVQAGLPTSYPGTTGARLPVCGGRISEP
ncbi:MAG: anhydro-N-acetylmuramic acid kinase, partial [Pseudomonadota bacterium]